MPLTRPSRRPALTLVEVIVALGVLGVLGAILLAAVQRVRQTAARAACLSQLRQLGLAVHQFHDARRALPIGVVRPYNPHWPDQFGPPYDPFPKMTWLTRLLPYIEQEALWKSTVQAMAEDPGVSKDPPHVGLSTRVLQFVCPADSLTATRIPLLNDRAPTSYLGVAGSNRYLQDGLLYMDSQVKLTDVVDGTSNTLLAGERPHNFAFGLWFGAWYGSGISCDFGATGNAVLGVRESGVLALLTRPSPCHDGPYSYRRGSLADPCSVFHFWSLHPGGGNWLFADGSARFLPYSAEPILKALATRAGGESVEL